MKANKISYFKITASVFSLILLLLFLNSFTDIKNNNPIISNEITLGDNQIFNSSKYCSDVQECEDPYYWFGDISFPEGNFISGTPVLLRVYDTKDQNFENFKIDCINEIKDLSFGFNGDISYYSGRAFGDYFNRICASKEVRMQCYDYSLRSFEKIQEKMPNNWKKNVSIRIGNMLKFLNNYSSNRNYYLKLEKDWDFIEKVGGNDFAFLYRRIENNKIPVLELVNYLNSLKSTISNSIDVNGYTNYRDIVINNELIISDFKFDNNSADVKILKKNSTKFIYIKGFGTIKCLKDNSKNYYTIYHNANSSIIYRDGTKGGEYTTVDSDLNIIENHKQTE